MLVCFILIILMSGFSLVFAQSDSEDGSASGSGGGAGQLHIVNSSNTDEPSIDIAVENPSGDVAVSGGGGGGHAVVTTANVASHATVIRPISVDATTANICVVDSELMKELGPLMILLEEVEESGNKEQVEMLYKKIYYIKEKIQADRKLCLRRPLNIAEPIEVKVRAINVGPTYVDKCSVLKDMKNKIKHYKRLYLLSEKELSDKGYSSEEGKEKIKKILNELEIEIEKVRIECEARTTTSGEAGEVTASGSSGGGGGNLLIPETGIRITKPVAVSSGNEITNYYKIKVSDIMIKEIKTGERITELKELRNEIDKLIEELIKSKDEIRVDEIEELVTKIKIKPGRIEADGVIVNTINKNIIVKINKKDLIIKPTKAHVSIGDGKFEIKAHELNVQNNTLRVGAFEIKILISEIVKELKIEPKEIELKEEYNKSVYKIRAEENRKLLWVIPIKVENSITVDAGIQELKIISEKLPWWGFLTVK